MLIAAILPLLAGSVLTPPQPPMRLFENIIRGMGRRASAVQVDLFIAPDREVIGCQAKSLRPPRGMDERDCQRLIGKKVEKPAIGPDGQPVYSYIEVVISTGSPPRPAAVPAKFVVEVADLPGASSEERVNLVLFINAAGTVTHCQQIGPGAQRLAEVACQQTGAHHWALRNGKEGTPVSYSATIGVDFVEKQ